MAVKAMVLGGGAREHALAKALLRGGADLYCVMSNNNPGIAKAASGVRILKETDVRSVVEAAEKWGVDVVVVGPEAPLGEGVADALTEARIRCAGPSKAAARLETDKSFMRSLMERHSLPGKIASRHFSSMDGIPEFLDSLDDDVAVKPVGLTGGKGVRMSGEHLRGREEILAYCRDILDHSIGGKGGLVLEQRLEGEEFTIQCLCDGKAVHPSPAVQDHKRAHEGDKGPNTGGMGSYSQADHLLPFLKQEEYDEGVRIVRAVTDAMAKEGCPYRGFLYGQFMLTRDGPKVIEFNARFGDPEAMNVLPLLEDNFTELCLGIADGRIPSHTPKFANLATVVKYVVPEGYGVKSVSNQPLSVDEAGASAAGAELFYAAVDSRPDGLFTGTSRAVGVLGKAGTIEAAERIAEAGVGCVRGRVFSRHDIGKPESIRRKVEHMERVRKGR